MPGPRPRISTTVTFPSHDPTHRSHQCEVRARPAAGWEPRAFIVPCKESRHDLAVEAGCKLAEHLWAKAERGSLRVERVDYRDSPYTVVFEIEDAGVKEPGAVKRPTRSKSWRY